MLRLLEPATAELVIKRSRFIGELSSVASQEEARELLRTRREQWEGATHVVHAFVLGPSGAILGCSDDGEPPGTAGRPALEVLKGSHITNAMLTVTRYFGGVKLGTGGLVKAYSDTAKAVLELAQTEELVAMTTFRISCSYPLYERIKTILTTLHATIDSEAFSTQIELTGSLRETDFPTAASQCRDASRGTAILQKETTP
ncbi:MAG: YigZ family protein [Victivallales bacterium]|nr:YigZ family protein [Victivallales bacterium]